MSALGTLSTIVLLVACGGGGEGDGAAGNTGGSGTTGSGGAMGASGASASSSGGASTGGAGGRAEGDDGSAGRGSTDAAVDVSMDTAGDRTASQCLGVNQMCDADGGGCCEAYVCRLGKCCTPTGIRSNCLTNSDCCSNSCILNQCTCVPRGYSCTGPGQCCSGFSCENGTCICPPDIRGCN